MVRESGQRKPHPQECNVRLLAILSVLSKLLVAVMSVLIAPPTEQHLKLFNLQSTHWTLSKRLHIKLSNCDWTLFLPPCGIQSFEMRVYITPLRSRGRGAHAPWSHTPPAFSSGNCPVHTWPAGWPAWWNVAASCPSCSSDQTSYPERGPIHSDEVRCIYTDTHLLSSHTI